MSGFVYVWYDCKHKRFYVGSHWGSSDDGYVCSSSWMKQAYRHRPEDFKRRIVATVNTNRKDLLAEEQRWLSMIKPHEVKVRYYNLMLRTDHHWLNDPDKNKSVAEKISKTLTGRPHDPEVVARRTASVTKAWECEELRAEQAERTRKLWEDDAHRENFSAKMTEKWADPEYREKMSESLEGIEARNAGCITAEKWQDPEFREMMRKRDEKKRTPEGRAKYSGAAKKKMSEPGQKEKVAEGMRKRWQDPEYRARMLAGRAAKAAAKEAARAAAAT